MNSLDQITVTIIFALIIDGAPLVHMVYLDIMQLFQTLV